MAIELSTVAQISGSIGQSKIPALLGSTAGYLSAAQIASLAPGGVFSTPDSAGFPTTRDGTGDNTAALNSWFQYLATNKVPGFLPAGIYRTTAEVLLPENAMYLTGAGRNLTRIAPAAKSYHGVRAKGSFNLATHGRYIGHFSVMSSDTSIPSRNGKMAFCLDNCPQALVEGVLADHHDIAFGAINNAYNASWRDCFTDRNNSNCNCGMYIGDGPISGADWVLSNIHVAGRITGICIGGIGGGYRFYGFSVGTQGIGGGSGSNYGVLTIGMNYLTDTVSGGNGACVFSGGHFEGWRNAYAIRSIGDNNFEVSSCGFNPSASESGQQAIGIIKFTEAANTNTIWFNNGTGPGQFQSQYLCSISGQHGGFNMVEFGWHGTSLNYAGPINTGLFANWMRSLMRWSDLSANERRGFATWVDSNDWRPTILLGKGMIKADNNNNRFTQSWDDGNTYSTL